jgi:hypothetical protein
MLQAAPLVLERSKRLSFPSLLRLFLFDLVKGS